jgi:hypothetical protein
MMPCSMSVQVIRLITPLTDRKSYLLITFMSQHTSQRHSEMIIKCLPTAQTLDHICPTWGMDVCMHFSVSSCVGTGLAMAQSTHSSSPI